MNNTPGNISEDQRIRKLVQSHLDQMEPFGIDEEGAQEAIDAFKTFRSELETCLDDQMSFEEEDDRQLLAQLIFTLAFDTLGDHRSETNETKQRIHKRIEQLIGAIGITTEVPVNPDGSTTILIKDWKKGERAELIYTTAEEHKRSPNKEQQSFKIELVNEEEYRKWKQAYDDTIASMNLSSQEIDEFHLVLIDAIQLISSTSELALKEYFRLTPDTAWREEFNQTHTGVAKGKTTLKPLAEMNMFLLVTQELARWWKKGVRGVRPLLLRLFKNSWDHLFQKTFDVIGGETKWEKKLLKRVVDQFNPAKTIDSVSEKFLGKGEQMNSISHLRGAEYMLAATEKDIASFLGEKDCLCPILHPEVVEHTSLPQHIETLPTAPKDIIIEITSPNPSGDGDFRAISNEFYTGKRGEASNRHIRVELVTDQQLASIKSRFDEVCKERDTRTKKQKDHFDQWVKIINQISFSYGANINKFLNHFADPENQEVLNRYQASIMGAKFLTAPMPLFGQLQSELNEMEMALQMSRRQRETKKSPQELMKAYLQEEAAAGYLKYQMLTNPIGHELLQETKMSELLEVASDTLIESLVEKRSLNDLQKMAREAKFKKTYNTFDEFLQFQRRFLFSITRGADLSKVHTFLPILESEVFSPVISGEGVQAERTALSEEIEIVETKAKKAFLLHFSDTKKELVLEEDYRKMPYLGRYPFTRTDLISLAQLKELRARFDALSAKLTFRDKKEQRQYEDFMVISSNMANSFIKITHTHYIRVKATQQLRQKVINYGLRRKKGEVAFDAFSSFEKNIISFENAVQTWNSSEKKDLMTLLKKYAREHFPRSLATFSSFKGFDIAQEAPDYMSFARHETDRFVGTIDNRFIQDQIEAAHKGSVSFEELVTWVESSGASLTYSGTDRLQILEPEAFDDIYTADATISRPDLSLQRKPENQPLPSAQEALSEDNEAIMVLNNDQEGYMEVTLTTPEHLLTDSGLSRLEAVEIKMISREKYTTSEKHIKRELTLLKTNHEDEKKEFMTMYHYIHGYFVLAINTLFPFLINNSDAIECEKSLRYIDAEQMLDFQLKLIKACRRLRRKKLQNQSDIISKYADRYLNKHLREYVLLCFPKHGIPDGLLESQISKVMNEIKGTSVNLLNETEVHKKGPLVDIIQEISRGLIVRFDSKNSMAMVPILEPELHVDVFGSSSAFRNFHRPDQSFSISGNILNFRSKQGLGSYEADLDQATKGAHDLTQEVCENPESTEDQLNEVRDLIVFFPHRTA